VAPVHSGIFVPLLPRGASPIFSTSTSPSNGGDPPAAPGKKVKSHVVVKTKHSAALPTTSHAQPKKPLVVSNNHPKGPKHK
jgi:hypothetical protein